jgi:hypothetical protein
MNSARSSRFGSMWTKLDLSFSNVRQFHFKKFSRAKHAKLAKAPPMSPFLLNFTLAPFAFFARDTDFFRSRVHSEISNMFG